MSKTVGFYGGKFLPLHNGHVYAMTVASSMVDELHIIVSYDDDYERKVFLKGSSVPHVKSSQRVRWIREITKHLPHVKVHAVQETNDGKWESWEKGAEGIKKAIGKEITHIFTSEPSYEPYLEKLHPNSKHVIIDENRNAFPISATKIRNEGVYANWHMLPDVVKRTFVKKVVFVGTESCGKSTLVQNLANVFNTSFVEEHGRTFYEEINSWETFEEDFPKIAYRHKYFEEEGLKKANKFLFIDTEAIITNRFLLEYHGKSSELLENIAKEQKYDLWILLKPDVKWIDDGSRILGEENIRWRGHEVLKNTLDYFDINYVEVGGDYVQRLNESIKLINNLI